MWSIDSPYSHMIKPCEFDAWNVTTKMQEKWKGYKCMIPLDRMKENLHGRDWIEDVSMSTRFQFEYAL
jgi:hypothetical protein